MSYTGHEITQAAVAAVNLEFSNSLAQIEHCVQQLNNEQIWWRLSPELNSIGNLLCHLAGNLRQWVIAGLGGGPDVRDRPREFAERGPLPLSAVWPPLQKTVREAQAVLSDIQSEPERLIRRYRIQGFEVSGWDAVVHTVTHFRGHTQEITGLSRQILGKTYRFAFVPSTREQGAAS